MKNYIPILGKTQMFSGVKEENILPMLSCLGARIQKYKKGEYVFRQGEHIKEITILAEGRLLIQKDDYWGNRSILSYVNAGDMFGEAYATPDSSALLNDVIALEDSTVIFFDVTRVITTCPSACSFHSLVVKNMFFALSDKNRQLVQKLGHLSERSTREKLVSYLSEQAKKQESTEFEIPYNRQQLADFLSVDRSAMSKELCRMRDEGMLSFRKNRFSLKTDR